MSRVKGHRKSAAPAQDPREVQVAKAMVVEGQSLQKMVGTEGEGEECLPSHCRGCEQAPAGAGGGGRGEGGCTPYPELFGRPLM